MCIGIGRPAWLLHHHVATACSVQLAPDLRTIVIAAIDVHGVEEANCVNRLDRRTGAFDVVSVRSVDCPAERHQGRSTPIDHFPAKVGPPVGFGPVPSPPSEVLWRLPSINTSLQSSSSSILRPKVATVLLFNSANMPSDIHSCRREHKVVSDTWKLRIATNSCHDEPFVSRVRVVPSTQPDRNEWRAAAEQIRR